MTCLSSNVSARTYICIIQLITLVMRKSFILAFLFATLPLVSYAQQGSKGKGKTEISINISGAPIDVNFEDDSYDYASDLASIYGMKERNYVYSPLFSVMGEYLLKNKISLGMEAVYWYTSKDYYDPFMDEVTGAYSRHSVALMPGIKYRYSIKKYFSLHSGVSAGAVLQFGKDGQQDINAVKPVFQVVPIGMRIGNDFYVTLEYYFGNIALGARVGIGYRF